MRFKDVIEKIRARVLERKKDPPHWLKDFKEGIALACRRPSSRLPKLRQLVYIPGILSKREKIVLTSALAIFFLSSILFGARFVNKRTVLQPKDGGTYAEGMVGAPQFVNPVFASSAKDIDIDLTALVFSGLLRYNDKQELVNDLAEKYTTSEDQKQYTFVLRKNILWHDGADFNADDVVFTFESIKDPQWKSPYQGRFRDVVIEKIDDYTVKFTLAASNQAFLDYLTIGIIPAHLWQDVPAVSATLSELNLKPVGTGPYVYSSMNREKKTGIVKEYAFERNSEFYRGRPHISSVKIKFFQDDRELSQALASNQIDGVKPIAVPVSDAFVKIPKNHAIHQIRLPQYTAAFFNKKNQILKDRGVREALLSGTRKQELMGTLGIQSLIDGPIMPDNAAYATDVKHYDYDKKRAEDLLDAAGYKAQDNGTRKKDNQELTLNLKTIDDPFLQKIAETLKNQWSEIGVKINIETIEAGRFQREVVRPRNFDIVLATEYVGRLNDFYPFWHSSQVGEKGFNLSGVANRDIDAALEAARQAGNPSDRIKKTQEAQNILVTTEIPALFLYQPIYQYIVDSKINGLNGQSLVNFSERFNNIDSWYEKTKRVWK